MAETNRIVSQTNEFDALDKLVAAYINLCNVPIVDDDYPEVRHYYESHLRAFLAACKANGRTV